MHNKQTDKETTHLLGLNLKYHSPTLTLNPRAYVSAQF